MIREDSVWEKRTLVVPRTKTNRFSNSFIIFSYRAYKIKIFKNACLRFSSYCDVTDFIHSMSNINTDVVSRGTGGWSYFKRVCLILIFCFYYKIIFLASIQSNPFCVAGPVEPYFRPEKRVCKTCFSTFRRIFQYRFDCSSGSGRFVAAVLLFFYSSSNVIYSTYFHVQFINASWILQKVFYVRKT
jgi:hypothetical protein